MCTSAPTPPPLRRQPLPFLPDTGLHPTVDPIGTQPGIHLTAGSGRGSHGCRQPHGARPRRSRPRGARRRRRHGHGRRHNEVHCLSGAPRRRLLLLLPRRIRRAHRAGLLLHRERRCRTPRMAHSRARSLLRSAARCRLPAVFPPLAPPLQVWGLWWAITTYAHYMQCLAARRGFRARGWQLLPFGLRRLRRLPLEPFVKLCLPLVGILGELWLGHESYRRLYGPDGRFTDNMNDWQHSTMYASFMASGLVDLLAHYCGAPPSTELVSWQECDVQHDGARWRACVQCRPASSAAPARCPSLAAQRGALCLPGSVTPALPALPRAAGLPEPGLPVGGPAAGVPPQGAARGDHGAPHPGAAGLCHG